MGVLAGKVALVTGATSGIGRATALRFAKEGARLSVVGRDRGALEATAAEAEAAVGEVHRIESDLVEDGQGARIVQETMDRFGRLDVVVNAAGIIGGGTVETTAADDWDAMMRINLDAVFHVMQAAAPHLRVTEGNIVNVSSVTGTRAFPGVLAYCVSKAAVDQLTRCAALELAAAGVRVNAVNPGVVVSRLHQRSGMDDDAYARFLEHSKTTHPMGRVGVPDDIAATILFLASSESGWLTGETISVDGGRHLTCAR